MYRLPCDPQEVVQYRFEGNAAALALHGRLVVVGR